ncbi:MAG: alpha/beta fold hydrolase [Bacteroidales bacterium]
MELFYRTEGKPSQPMLLILHGLYGMSDNWVTLARRYAEKFFVVLPDLRNHGLSPHAPEHTYEAMTNDVEELIAHLSPDSLSLMGHSMGGKVAMLLALRQPHLINRLIIADIGPGATPGASLHHKIGQALLSIKPEKFFTRGEIGNQLLKSIPQPAIVQLMLKNIGKNTEGQFYWKPNIAAILQNLDTIAGAIELQGYFSNPTLLLKGENSDYVTDTDIETVLQHFILLREVTLPGAGHWLHADKPEEFFRITYDFLLST